MQVILRIALVVIGFGCTVTSIILRRRARKVMGLSKGADEKAIVEFLKKFPKQSIFYIALVFIGALFQILAVILFCYQTGGT